MVEGLNKDGVFEGDETILKLDHGNDYVTPNMLKKSTELYVCFTESVCVL